MTDDELLAEYERGPARRAAFDSRVREALLAAVRGDNAAYLTLLRFLLMDAGGDISTLLISYGRVYCTDLVACQGRELTERRLESNIAYGREIVLEEEQ